MLKTAETNSLEDWAIRKPGFPAVICGDNTLTYGEWNRQSNCVADALLKEGFKPGDRLGMRFQLCPEWFILQRALQKIGVIQVAVNFKLTPDEALFILKDSGAIGLACDDKDVEPWQNADIGRLITVGQSTSDAGVRLEDLISFGGEVERFGSMARAMILYTSGTTGTPKGVAPGFREGVTMESLMAYAASIESNPPHQESGVDLLTLPVHHGAGPAQATACLRSGGTIVLLPRFDPLKAIELIDKHKVQFWVAVPTMLLRIQALPDDTLAQYDLSSLAALSTGAAPVPQSLKEWAVEKLGPNVLWEAYGASEAGMISYTPPEYQLKKPGTSGIPYASVEIKIIDENWNSLPAGETGEIVVKTPAVFTGYLNNSVSSEGLVKDGFYRTGDVGHLDEDGFLFITDRIKDMIVAGGVNIYPAEIEHAIQRHPDVEYSAVIGIPNGDFGETPYAFIMLKQSAAPMDEQVMKDFLADKLAKYKWPKGYEFVDELPLNSMGKITKQPLREPFWKDQERKV